jgi:uncharacterized membrane protein YjgN (DUF898 family)
MGKPDYGALPLEELLEIERHMDPEAAPERYAEVRRQIELRHSGMGPAGSGNAGEADARSDAQEPEGARAVFTGSAGEYFRIWIVNLLFSLLTLGIYSAWATVRNRRYLYGNVELDGSRFDFHGSPLAILRGRILAVLLFAAYAFGGDFHYAVPLVALCLLIVAAPWIMVAALRFRLSNTSWKSLRFGFEATTGHAYRTFAVPAAITLVAYGALLGQAIVGQGDVLQGNLKAYFAWVLVMSLLAFWLIPTISFRARNLAFNNACFGQHRFSADIDSGVFYAAFLKAAGLGIVAIFAAILVTVVLGAALFPVIGLIDKQVVLATGGAVFYVVLILVYLLPFALWHVRTTNHAFSALRIEGTHFSMSMKVLEYWSILVTNAIAAVLTLGLALPWAKVRMIRFRLRSLRIQGELGGFAGDRAVTQSATGDQIGDAFDIDFGF